MCVCVCVCVCVFQAFRDEIAPLKPDVRAVNDLAGQLTPLDVQLSSTTNRQLDNLNMRWKLLQVLCLLPYYFYFSFPFCFPSSSSCCIHAGALHIHFLFYFPISFAFLCSLIFISLSCSFHAGHLHTPLLFIFLS